MARMPTDPGATAEPALARSKVKGAWFVTARRFALERYGEEALAQVIALMQPPHRRALERPLTSAWYEEEALKDSFAAARVVLAEGSDEKMLHLFEECARIGVSHFWRIALRVTSTEFAVRMLPATWRHMRRGPGTMTVDVNGRRAAVRYSHFPFFDDINYRLLVLGSLRQVLRMSTGVDPRVTITGFGDSWLEAAIEFP
jgi:hypothetical protein